MYLRASEERRKHSETSRQLAAETEKRKQEFYSLVPGGEEAFNRGVVVRGPVELGEAYKAAEAAVQQAQEAEEAHQANQPNPIREYRVTSIDGKEVYDYFTDDHVKAKNIAAKMMAEKEINRYGLDEKLGDGSWVPFELPRDSSAASS